MRWTVLLLSLLFLPALALAQSPGSQCPTGGTYTTDIILQGMEGKTCELNKSITINYKSKCI